jgi:hypothetical protein
MASTLCKETHNPKLWSEMSCCLCLNLTLARGRKEMVLPILKKTILCKKKKFPARGTTLVQIVRQIQVYEDKVDCHAKAQL